MLLGHSGTVSINPVLYKSLKFDARTDLQAVAMVAQSALVLVVPANSKANSVVSLVAEAKAAGGAWNFASAGAGTGGHLTGELFQQISGISMRHIPYKGTAPALADVAGSQVQMCFSVIPPALALIKAGKLKAAATSEFQQRLATEGAVSMLGGSVEYARLIKTESAKWAEVVRVSGAIAE